MVTLINKFYFSILSSNSPIFPSPAHRLSAFRFAIINSIPLYGTPGPRLVLELFYWKLTRGWITGKTRPGSPATKFTQNSHKTGWRHVKSLDLLPLRNLGPGEPPHSGNQQKSHKKAILCQFCVNFVDALFGGQQNSHKIHTKFLVHDTLAIQPLSSHMTKTASISKANNQRRRLGLPRRTIHPDAVAQILVLDGFTWCLCRNAYGSWDFFLMPIQ